MWIHNKLECASWQSRRNKGFWLVNGDFTRLLLLTAAKRKTGWGCLESVDQISLQPSARMRYSLAFRVEMDVKSSLGRKLEYQGKWHVHAEIEKNSKFGKWKKLLYEIYFSEQILKPAIC